MDFSLFREYLPLEWGEALYLNKFEFPWEECIYALHIIMDDNYIAYKRKTNSTIFKILKSAKQIIDWFLQLRFTRIFNKTDVFGLTGLLEFFFYIYLNLINENLLRWLDTRCFTFL